MPDFEERIKLTIDGDEADKVTKQINAGITSVEKNATAASKAIGDATDIQVKKILSTQQASQRTINSVIRQAETRATFAGADPLTQIKLRTSLDLKRVAGDQDAVNKITAAGAEEYRKLAAAKNAADVAGLLRGAQAASAAAARDANQFARALISVNKEAANLKQSAFDEGLRKAQIASRGAATEADAFQRSLVRLNKSQRDEVAALQQRAAFAGKSGVDRLILERDLLTKSLGSNTKAIKAAEAAYAHLIEVQTAADAASAAESHGGIFSRSSAGGRTLLGIKDLAEGRTAYGEVELGTAVSKLSGLTAIAAGAGLVLAGAAIAAVKMTTSAATAAKETQNLGIRLGSTSDEAFRFQAQAKLAGVNAEGLTSFMRTLSRSLADGGAEGKRGAEGLRAIGVEGRDAAGNLKPTVELIHDISAGLKGLDPKVAEAKLSEFGGRGTVELLPFFQSLDKTDQKLASIGFSIKGGLIDKLADAHDQLQLFDVAWDLFKAKVAEKVLAIVDVTVKVHEVAGGGGPNLPEGGAASSGLTGVYSAAGALSYDQPLTLKGRPFVPPIPSGGLAFQETIDSIARGNALLDAHATKLNTIEGLQAQITKDQEAYNAAEAKLDSRGQRANIALAEIADANRAASTLRQHKEALTQLEAQESARANFAKKAADDLYDAEKKLYDLRAGEANKERAFTGAATNVAKAVADFNDRVKKEALAQNVPESAIAQKLGPERTAKLTAAAIEDANIRRKFYIDESEYEAELRNQQADEEFRREVELSTRIREIRQQAAQSTLRFEETIAASTRDRELRSVENTDAKTLDAKLGYLRQAAGIESSYELQIQAVRLRQREESDHTELAEFKAQFDARTITALDFANAVRAINDSSEQFRKELAFSTDDAIAAHNQEAATKSAEAVRDAYTREFDSFKSGLSRLFDSIGNKGASVGKFLKSEILGLFKEVASTQGARLLTELSTGQHVGLTGTTPATGGFSKLLQAIGIGTKPTFDSINKPGHIGDATLISGAVPVYVANHQDISGGGAAGSSRETNINISGGGGGLSLARSPIAATLALALGLGGGTGALQAGTTPSVSSQITFGATGTGGGLLGSAIPGSPEASVLASVLNLSTGGGSGSSGTGGGSGSGPDGIGSIAGGSTGSGSSILDALPFLSPGGQRVPGVNSFGGGGVSGNNVLLGGLIGTALGAGGGFLGARGPGAQFGGLLGGGLGALVGGLIKGGQGSLLKGGLGGLGKFFFNSPLAAQTNFGNGGIGSIASGIFGSPAAGAIGASLLGLSLQNPLGAPLRSGVQAGAGGGLLGASLAAQFPKLGISQVGGAAIGAGAGQVLQGLIRGGTSGIFQTAAGGAAIGASIGIGAGPIGSLLGGLAGAGAGALAGVVRDLFQTGTQQVQSKIKSVYGVNVTDQSVLQQLNSLASSTYGGDVLAAVTSQQGRQLIQLYAQSTGQKATGILATPQAAIFSNTGGSLQELPTYFNGQAVFPGQTQSTIGLPVLSGSGLPIGNTAIPTGANTVPPTSISLDAEATTALLQGQATQVIQGSAPLIAMQAQAGSTQTNTQRSTAASLLAPSQILS